MLEKVKRFLGCFFGDSQTKECQELSEEEIQNEFKRRYHQFKLLLTANKRALEIMSDLERALHGSKAFGMAFIRSQATAVSVNVYRIIEHLSVIAPDKYAALFERFKDIQRHLTALFERSPPEGDLPLTIPLVRAGRELADQVGGKMAGIGEIASKTGLAVPHGFAITARAYRLLLDHNDLADEINRLVTAAGPDDQEHLLTLSSRIRTLITQADIPHELDVAIHEAYDALAAEMGQERVYLSVRSSALGEDEAGQTFAGQFSSKLNVSPEDLLDSYKEIVASKYSPQAMTYRLNRGIPDEDIAMCVGVMALVEARSGGVIYSRNPLDIRDDHVFIHASWGLPKTVVDGSVATDEYVVDRAEPPRLIKKEIREKDKIFVCLKGEGVCLMKPRIGDAGLPCLSDAEALDLARSALRLEAMHGAPVDVEWAIDATGKCFFLQCRELTQMDPGDDVERPTAPHGLALVVGGTTASPGVAAGEVFWVRREADLLAFPRGAVLVSPEAPPRWASIIDKAAAIVTRTGGAAGHLANVAREFQVPALMGAPESVNALTQGQLVTVDADGRAVYQDRVPEILAHARPRKAPESHTPMHAILRRVMDHITPLHLLDPASPDFKAENCRTLHDITRFCHEKSVTEMFRFGQDFDFSKRAAKQLKYKGTAMKWWFINLDDGFSRDVPGKFVKLEDIASIPVVALWDGIVAVPWQGPPPVSARGFMSIVVQASSNPHLEASSHSSFAERNYFMVSKNYMCLSSRFGFHFCTVETLVTDRPQENYVSFQFKGGAAEFARRRRRAEFVGEILTQHGFAMEINEDSAFARINGGSPEVMLEAVKIIGYMLMHTRQLDMIMHNASMVATYRQRILDDLRTVIKAGAPADNGT